MKIFSLLLGVLLICYNNSAEANGLDSSFFKNLTEVSGSIKSEYSLQLIEQINKSISLFRFFEVQESGAKKIVFLPGPAGSAQIGQFDLKTMTLTVGPTMGNTCPTGYNGTSIAEDLHEMAHSVFTPNLYKKFGLTREPDPIVEGFSITHAVLVSEEKEMSKVVTIRDLSAPFEELFADFFAVLVVEDPFAMTSGLQKCSGKEQPRSFVGNYNAETWDGGSLKPKSMFIAANVHDVLSPSRPKLWELYLNLTQKFDIQTSKRMALAAMFDSSIELIEVLSNRKITYAEWFRISKSDLNKELINLLDQQFIK